MTAVCGFFLRAVGEDIEAVVVVAEADIDQQQIVVVPLDGRDRGGVSACRIDLIALLPQPVGHRGQQVPIVVHQQQRSFAVFSYGYLGHRMR